jgi:hypothetical protein
MFRVALFLCWFWAPAVAAGPAIEFWPGAAYDARIPTFEKVLGYAPGEHITPPSGILSYLDALAAAAPDRLKVFQYGESWEGRKLVYAAVGSEANIRRLAGSGRACRPWPILAKCLKGRPGS